MNEIWEKVNKIYIYEKKEKGHFGEKVKAVRSKKKASVQRKIQNGKNTKLHH